MRLIFITIFVSWFVAAESVLWGQDGSLVEKVPGSKLLSPESFGFKIPTALPVPSPFENVAIKDAEGDTVIAKVHAKIGDNYLVLLPNGKIVSKLASEVSETDKKFRPARHADIASELRQGPLRQFRVKTTKHYVFIYNTTDGFAEVAQKVLESMRRGVTKSARKALDLEIHPPQVPLVVLMFHTEAEFRAHSQDAQVPRGAFAYYNIINNHIVLHEESGFASTRIELARQELISTIAHEGAHQILHNIGVQQRLSLWPMWLGEGLAEYFAPTTLTSDMKWKGAGEINDLRMFDLEIYLQVKAVGGFSGDTITRAVGARSLDSTGYAISWAICLFLADAHKDKFVEYIELMSQLGPLRGMTARQDQVPENLADFQRFFAEDTGLFEQQMVDYLVQQDYFSPVVDLPHSVMTIEYPVETGLQRHACLFHRTDLVENWIGQVREKLTEDQMDGATWEQQTFVDRDAASKYIKRFMKNRR